MAGGETIILAALALLPAAAILFRRGLTPTAPGQAGAATRTPLPQPAAPAPIPPVTGPRRRPARDMTFSGEILEFLREREGLRLRPYRDAAGVATIGYGHTGPTAAQAIREGTAITEETADRLLYQDTIDAAADVRSLVTVPLTQGEFDALVSFVFNLGAGALERSTLRKKLNAGDYAGAAEEFPRWVFATPPGGEPIRLAGLVSRRNAEREIFTT